MGELPPPIHVRREPHRSEWVAQLAPKRWYHHPLAWIGAGLLGAAALVAAAALNLI